MPHQLHHAEALHKNSSAVHVIECSAHVLSKGGLRTAELRWQFKVLESAAAMTKWLHVRLQYVPLLCSLLCCLLDFIFLEASQCASVKSARQQVTSACSRQAMHIMHTHDHCMYSTLHVRAINTPVIITGCTACSA